MLHLRIDPTDLGKQRSLPPPIVTINGEVQKEDPVSYSIKNETTAIVDVTDAINYVRKQREVLLETQNNVVRQTNLLQETVSRAGALSQTFNGINQFLTTEACPGGPHGLPIPHGGDFASQGSAAVANLQSLVTAIQKEAIPAPK
jgi:hypothetical protein